MPRKPSSLITAAAVLLITLGALVCMAASPYEDCPAGVETAFRQLSATMQDIKEASRPCAELRDEFIHATDPADMRAAGMNAIAEGCW